MSRDNFWFTRAAIIDPAGSGSHQARDLMIRVRIKDDGSATLTLKSRSSKFRRREFEYAIPTSEAEELLSLRRGHIVEKVRYIVPRGNLNWEIDVFSGENLGNGRNRTAR